MPRPREAARALDFPFTLTARAENHFRRNPDLDDTIARLQAYEEAGADVIYAPGIASGDEIRAISEATSKPQNVLGFPPLTMSEITAAGGQRVSVGSQLTWVAVGAFAKAAEEIRDTGEFTAFAETGADQGLAHRLRPPAIAYGWPRHLPLSICGSARPRNRFADFTKSSPSV